MDATKLDAAVRAVCPALQGVSIGDPADRATWRLDFGPDVTDAQRQAAQAALQAFVYSEAAPFPDISDRQCFQQLAIQGKVTTAEALAAVTVGALPKAVTDGIAALPADQQFAAQMLLCGATTFHRAHPMTAVFGSFFGMGPDDLDNLWRAAALL